MSGTDNFLPNRAGDYARREKQLTNRITALQVENEWFKQWFSDNGAALATHRIGGYHFVGGRLPENNGSEMSFNEG